MPSSDAASDHTDEPAAARRRWVRDVLSPDRGEAMSDSSGIHHQISTVRDTEPLPPKRGFRHWLAQHFRHLARALDPPRRQQ